jgi:hypothetical protein
MDALGSSGHDEVVVHHVDQGVPHDQRVLADEGDREDEPREREVVEDIGHVGEARQVRPRGRVSAGREERGERTVPLGERHEHQDPEPELRHRVDEQREPLRANVEPAPPPPPAVDADEETDRRGGDRGGGDQEQGGPDTLVDRKFHVLTLEGERVPEVKRERVLHIDEELLWQGFVQAEVLRHLLDVRWVEFGRSLEQQFRGIARDHAEQEEVEGHHEGQGQQRLQHLAEDVPATPPGSSNLLPVEEGRRTPPQLHEFYPDLDPPVTARA